MHRVTGSGIVGGRRRRPEGTALRRQKLLLVIPIFALVLQACGTRLPDSAFTKAQNSRSGQNISAGDEGLTDQSSSGGTGADQGSAGAGGTGGAGGAAGASGAAAGKAGGAGGGGA